MNSNSNCNNKNTINKNNINSNIGSILCNNFIKSTYASKIGGSIYVNKWTKGIYNIIFEWF